MQYAVRNTKNTTSLKRQTVYGETFEDFLMDKLAYIAHLNIYYLKKLLGKESGCPVLAYHKINNMDPNDRYAVKTEDFEEHMRYLFYKGYRTISLSKYVKFISAGKKIPSKNFVLTFDDGYEDFYTNALPILKKYNFNATVFIVINLIGKENEWDKKNGYLPCRLMNWMQINEIVKEGIEIGSHTLNHVNLTSCNDDSLEHEINQSKQILQDKTGCKIEFFAYPFGKFTDKVKNIVENNYISACAISEDNDRYDQFAINRVNIANKDSAFKVYTKMTGTYCKVRDLGLIK